MPNGGTYAPPAELDGRPLARQSLRPNDTLLDLAGCVFGSKVVRLALNDFHGKDTVLIPGGSEPVCACP